MFCEKKAFTNIRECNTILNAAKRNKFNGKRNSKHIPKRAYKCEKCGFYHLTSKPIY